MTITKERPQMKQVGFSQSYLPVSCLTDMYTCPKIPHLDVV